MHVVTVLTVNEVGVSHPKLDTLLLYNQIKLARRKEKNIQKPESG